MKPSKLHRILPPLVMSAAVIAPGASAAAIILHAKNGPTTSLASGVSISRAPASTPTVGSTATAQPTATQATSGAFASSPARKKVAVSTPTVAVPTATAAPQPTATLQSSALQAQSSSSSNVVSGATRTSG